MIKDPGHRTREQELQDSLVGCTVEEVKVDERTGLAVIRCSPPGGGSEDPYYFCFDVRSFADAASIWNVLT